MPEFETIKRDEAPTPESNQQQTMEMFETFVRNAARQDEVGHLILSQGETYRGIAKSLHNAASRLDVDLDVWKGNQPDDVYFLVKGDTRKLNATRPRQLARA